MSEDIKYDNLKNLYKDYLREIEKSKSLNSLARYQVEHTLLNNMYKIAREENRTEEFEYINKRYDVLQDKFKKFGIVLKGIEQENSH